MSKNGADVKMNLPTDAELVRMFDMVPHLERGKVIDTVVKAGCEPIVKRARDLAPRSTGKSKRSKSQAAKADWAYPLWKTIKRVIRKYDNRYGLGVIGPEWPKGNKAYFNTSPKGRKRKLWGKDPDPNGGLSAVAPQVRNWIVQAFDETKSEQTSAMKDELTKQIDKMMKEAFR